MDVPKRLLKNFSVPRRSSSNNFLQFKENEEPLAKIRAA
jgi:hypothetical protein